MRERAGERAKTRETKEYREKWKCWKKAIKTQANGIKRGEIGVKEIVYILFSSMC